MRWCASMKAETATAPGETQTASGREEREGTWSDVETDGFEKVVKTLAMWVFCDEYGGMVI